MAMVAQAGEVAGLTMVFLVVGGAIGIPFTSLLVRNHRTLQAQRYRHMDGWVPGVPPDQSKVVRVPDPPSAYGTKGPRVIASGGTGMRRWVRLVHGEIESQAKRARPTAGVGEPIDRDAVIAAAEHKATHDDYSFLRGTTDSEEPSAPWVLLLGQPQVVGWIQGTEPEQLRITELACFLESHDRKMMAEEIAEALWPGGLETLSGSIKSVQNAISHLRKCLGRSYVPEAARGQGYRLDAVNCDWRRFEELRHKASSGTQDEAKFLGEALELVRGRPFEGVAPDTYTWAWKEFIASTMEGAIVDAAKRYASLMLAAAQPERAREGATKGLLASPYDRELWALMLKACSMLGASELDREWRNVEAALVEDASALRPLYEELRSA